MIDILGTTQSSPRYRPPPGACDCHTHLFGPVHAYPYDPARAYTPPDAPLADLERLHAHLGIDRVVIVHPSPYGTDNRISADAVRQLGPHRARGVAVIGDPLSDMDLRTLDNAGMCGARENVETAGVFDPALAWHRLDTTARRVAPLGWHVQVFTRLAVIAALAERIPSLPTTLVIDHFGRPDAARGVDQPGFDALRRLLATGKVYVKLSASYRTSDRPDHADMVPLARALIAENPDRLVWGTDWPHPGGGVRGPAHRDSIEPFKPIDDGAALDRLCLWADGDRVVLRKILVDNPARLYGFATDDRKDL